MAITKKKSDFPGSKTFTTIYNSIPGSPLVKNIIIGVVAAVAVVGAIAVAGAGIVAATGAFAALLAAPLLVQMGVLVTITALFIAAKTIIPIIFRFDFNISDKKIEEAMKTSLDQLYEPFGEFLGNALGFLVCGAAPGALAFVFSPVMAYTILREVGEEAYEELVPQMSNLMRMAGKSYANAMALQAFGSARKWIKRPGTPFHEIFKRILGAKGLKEWGEQNDAPFILNNKINERIEKIEDKNIQALAEGAWEGFVEGCGEGANVVSHRLQDQLATQRLAARAARNPTVISVNI